MRIGEVKANGELATLHIKVNGIGRRVAVTREAIEDDLGVSSKNAGTISVEAQCDFVRRELRRIIAATHRKIGAASDTSEVIVIRTGEL